MTEERRMTYRTLGTLNVCDDDILDYFTIE